MREISGATRRRQRSPIRRRIDQQRVQLWYAWLRSRSRGKSSYALEKALIPEGFTRATGGAISHRNRMARYAQGKHVPRDDLVERAEQVFPGSRPLLEHPYWTIIDPDVDVTANSAAWLGALGSEVRNIVFKTRSAATELALRRRKLTRVTLRQLENRGTFEALAALALLLREARETRNDELAFDCAHSFWRVLLLVLSSIPFVTHLSEITELAGDALLDHVIYRGEQVAIAKAHVHIHIHEDLLRSYCLYLEDEGKLKPDWRSWVRERLLLIRGTKGLEFFYALRMPTEATDELRDDDGRHVIFEREQFARFKAWDYLYDSHRTPRSFTEDIITFLADDEGHWPDSSTPRQQNSDSRS